MAVRIRLTRIGRMHRPFYRIAAFDTRTRRDGRALEYLGYYDPMLTTGTRVKIDKDKAEAWIAKGAQPSETVASFLREIGVQYKKTARNRKRNKARAGKRKSATPNKK
ncbi:MAG: 30S ribosomal protein S16 [Planctomycetes bacterium]|nr:30S ribosomal protein S16 [Planctomycetota bacterium]